MGAHPKEVTLSGTVATVFVSADDVVTARRARVVDEVREVVAEGNTAVGTRVEEVVADVEEARGEDREEVVAAAVVDRGAVVMIDETTFVVDAFRTDEELCSR